MYDAIIIGAGVTGGLTAMTLARYNMDICIIERENDIAMGSTKANSAIVHAGFDAKCGSLKAILNVKGSKMMPQICKDLNVDYQNNGSLVIGFGDEDKAKLEELKENGIKNGVEGLSIIGRDELLKLEPNIGDEATCALYAPTGAIVCPYELTEASIGNAMDNGAKLELNFEVEAITENNGIYTVKSKDGKVVEGKIVINAAGLYADKIASMVGDNSFKIHPRRGEYLLMDKECGNLVSNTIFTVPTKMGKGILVSPTVDHNLILGPTSEDRIDKEDKNTTPNGIASVTESAKKSVNGIDFRMVITSFCGLRAVGDKGDFIINMPKRGFVNAAAIESPGLSSSPAIAEYIVDLLKENGFEYTKKQNPVTTRESFKHFTELPIEKKNEIIAKDPTFGNIICRCECVSEGEILHALRTNPKPTDLDGIKRRTRAQMGRCQGGFCSPYIMKIISDELGIPMEEITKKGNQSTVIVSKTKEGVTNA